MLLYCFFSIGINNYDTVTGSTMDRLCRVERLLQFGGGFGMARGPRIGQVSSAAQQLRESLSLQNTSAVNASIVPATAKRYASAVMLYERVCGDCGLIGSGGSAFVPPSTQTLLYFVNYAARLGHKAAAIRLFLSAIRREALLRDLPDLYTSSGQVPLIVAAAILGNQRAPPTLRADAIRPRSKRVERIPAGPAIIDALLKYAPRVIFDQLELTSFRFFWFCHYYTLRFVPEMCYRSHRALLTRSDTWLYRTCR